MKDGAQFAAEARRRRDVDEDLEAEAAVRRLRADRLHELVQLQSLEGVRGDGRSVLESLAPAPRGCPLTSRVSFVLSLGPHESTSQTRSRPVQPFYKAEAPRLTNTLVTTR